MTAYTNNAERLAALNAYRVAADQTPVKAWNVRYTDALNAFDAAAKRAARKAAKSSGNEDIADKVPAYKQFMNNTRSTIMKPVEFVHAFLDANPELTRKAAVHALVEKGINYSTARTQFQRHFANR